MDTQSDSSALDTNQAAAVFADMLTPPEEKQEAQPEAQEPKVETEAKDEGVEETTQEAETEAQDDDPTVTVKVDGKEVEVKLSELKRGYQMDKAASQRFEQAAELRKAAEAETQKAQAERNAYQQNLQKMQAALEIALQEQGKTDWDSLLANDPVEYLKQQRLAQERQALLQRTYAEQQQLQAIQQAEAQKAHMSYLEQQRADLLSKLPEWADESKAKAEKTALRDYLLKSGFDEQSVDNVSDAKAVLMARKAMLYDQMVEKASAAAKKVQNLPSKVERPAGGQNPGLDRRSNAFQKLSKSGSVDDAAAVFAGLL